MHQAIFMMKDARKIAGISVMEERVK